MYTHKQKRDTADSLEKQIVIQEALLLEVQQRLATFTSENNSTKYSADNVSENISIDRGEFPYFMMQATAATLVTIYCTPLSRPLFNTAGQF